MAKLIELKGISKSYDGEKVIDGISNYIDSNIYSGMNDLQEFIARIVVGRVIDNSAEIKSALANNGVIRTFGFIDEEGMIDIDHLMSDIKNEIRRKGEIHISIPMFGKLKFVPEDVDVLHRFILEA